MDIKDIRTKEEGDEYKRTLGRTSRTPHIEKLIENVAKGYYQIIPTTHYKPEGYKTLDEGREDFSIVVKYGKDEKLLMDDLFYSRNHTWQDLFPVTAYNLMEFPEHENTGYVLFALGKHREIMGPECSEQELLQNLYEAVKGDFESLSRQQDVSVDGIANFLRETKGLSAAAVKYGMEDICQEISDWSDKIKQEHFYEMSLAESKLQDDKQNTLYETIALQYDRREFTGYWKNLNNDFVNITGPIYKPDSVECAVYNIENTCYDAINKMYEMGDTSAPEFRECMLTAGISAVVLDCVKNSRDYEQHVLEGNSSGKEGLSEYFIRDESNDMSGMLRDFLDDLCLDWKTRTIAEEISSHMYCGSKDFMDYFHDEFAQMQENPLMGGLISSLNHLCELKVETPDIQETLFALRENGYDAGFDRINAEYSINALLDKKAESLVSEIKFSRDEYGMLGLNPYNAKSIITELAETMEMADKYLQHQSISIDEAKKTLRLIASEGEHPANPDVVKPDGQISAERTARQYILYGLSSLDKSCIREDTARVLNAVEKCAAISCQDKAPSHAGENFGKELEQRLENERTGNRQSQKKQYEYAD